MTFIKYSETMINQAEKIIFQPDSKIMPLKSMSAKNDGKRSIEKNTKTI